MPSERLSLHSHSLFSCILKVIPVFPARLLSRPTGEAWSSSSQETAPQCFPKRSLDLQPLGPACWELLWDIHGASAPVSTFKIHF